MKGFTLVSLALVGLVSTALSQERIVPKTTECIRDCDFKYGYAYDINLGNRIWVGWDNINSAWFPVMNFTYQVWIKPHVLSSDRTQQVVGNVYSTSYMYYNHGIIIDKYHIYLRAGENSMDLLANAVGYDLRPHLFKWVHVTATFELTDTEQIGTLYINGEFVNEKRDMGVGQKIDTNIYIGATRELLHYTGLADEVRFFSRVLTPDEIKDTWNRTLTSEEIEKDDSLLFYFNADGERYNEPKDKSKYNRAAKWVTESDSGHLANRTNVVANCMGCFNYGMPAFCIPTGFNTGHCGDGIVMGDEECDGGEGCGDDCKCEENYTAHGLPYCKEYYFNKTQGEYNMSEECVVSTAINKCLPAMNPIECDCECFKVKGIDCLLSENCDADTIGFKLYTTWGACLSRCPDNDYCYDLIPDYCARFRTAEACQNSSRIEHECTWCGSICVSMETACPPVMGNGVIDECEQCDDGNFIDGDGCDSSGLLEEGFMCNVSAVPTECKVRKKYVLTFDYVNESEPEVQFLYSEEAITYPKDVKREGYTFVCWDKVLAVMPEHNVTITAMWTKAKKVEYVKITFASKDLTENETLEAIKKYAEEGFEIVKIDVDTKTGEKTVIIKFENEENAKRFVQTISVSEKIVRDISFIGGISFSFGIVPLLLLYLLV